MLTGPQGVTNRGPLNIPTLLGGAPVKLGG